MSVDGKLKGWTIENVEWHVTTLEPVALTLRGPAGQAVTLSLLKRATPEEMEKAVQALDKVVDPMQRFLGAVLSEAFLSAALPWERRMARMAGATFDLTQKYVETEVRRGPKRQTPMRKVAPKQHPGCGLPGHVGFGSGEGTHYCLTCETTARAAAGLNNRPDEE